MNLHYTLVYSPPRYRNRTLDNRAPKKPPSDPLQSLPALPKVITILGS